MADSRRNIYWDSCVFLSYINGMEERIPILEALLQSSSSANGDVKIYTSIMSKVEVAYATTERSLLSLDSSVEENISALWADAETVISVEFHDLIAIAARDLIRNALAEGWSLKPQDSVHLATARWLSESGIEIDEFHTYDRALNKYAAILGFRILEPNTPQPNLL